MQARSHRRTTVITTIVLAALVSATAVVAGAPPASAGVVVSIAYANREPLTWVDDDGSQYLIAEVLTGMQSGSGTYEWVIGRSLPDGTPDPAWGSYSGSYYGTTNTGVRPLVLDPPAEGLEFSSLAVDDHGTITAVWPTAGCTQPGVSCERWLTRHDATGAQVGEPVVISGRTLGGSLSDGSVLATTSSGAIAWVGPDGTDRGYPDLGGSTAAAFAVDHSGRLLVATADHRLVRWPAGGPIDLEVDLGACADGSTPRIGRSVADDSFATACRPVGDEPLRVERRGSDGAVLWTGEPPTVQIEGRMTSVSSVIVDASGSVWVGGGGPIPAYGDDPTRAEFLQVFADGEVSAPVAWRNGTSYPFYEYGDIGPSELRPAPGGRIAYVNQVDCCEHPQAGTAPDSYTYAGIAQARPVEPPTCQVAAPTLDAVTRTSAHVELTPCSELSDPVHQTTGYRVEVRSGGSPTTTDHPMPERLAPIGVDVALTPGVLSTIDITPTNRAGAGNAASTRTTRLVAPFPTVDAFVDRQIHDLLRSPDEVPRNAVIESVANGSTAPADLIDGWLTGRLTRSGNDVQPVARLYEAFFLRAADTGGLEYWVNRRVHGTKLAVSASTFAASSEFKRRYGTLSNKAFVAQLYRNVFNREADPSGLAYWTNKLDRRTLSRGGVVTQFSESSENLRRAARYTEPLAAKFLMLGQTTSASERSGWAAAPDPQRAAIEAILASPAYDDTVPAS